MRAPSRTTGVRPGRRVTDKTPIGKLMREDDLRIAQVSAATGIHYNTVADYAAGRKPIKSAHLAKLSNFFDVEPEELVAS